MGLLAPVVVSAERQRVAFLEQVEDLNDGQDYGGVRVANPVR